MRRVRITMWFLAAASVSIAATSGALRGAAQPAPKPLYCEGRAVTSMDGVAHPSRMKAYMKSPTVYRIEQSAGNHSEVIITNGGDSWLLDPGSHTGQHRKWDEKMMASLNSRRRVVGDDLPPFLQAGARKVGRQTVEGTACDLYRLTNKGGVSYSLWVIPGEEHLTKKQEMVASGVTAKRPGVSAGRHTVRRSITYVWQPGMAWPDSFFRPPAGYKISESGAQPAPQSK